MNRKLILTLQIVLLVVAGAVLMAGSQGAGAALPSSSGAASSFQKAQSGREAPQAPAGSGFTYQGQLKSGGNPANGQFDFQFKLFDAASGGMQVGSTVTVANQTVTGGLFTVVLDFGSSAFGGQARWLEIAVRPAGGGTYTTLSPRQPLTATPYAMSVMPGAVITGTLNGPALMVTNTNTIGVQGTGGSQHGGLFTNNSTTGYAALQGIASGTPGYGIYGEGNSVGVWGSTLNGTGVRGVTTDGYGVHGYSVSNGTGVRGESIYNNGIHGISTNSSGVRGFSTNGWGVSGVSANGTGVRGTTSSSTPGVAAVYGISSNNGDGVRGDANSGAGVRGTSNTNDGVFGISTDGHGVVGVSTNNSAVYGSAGSSAYGVYGHGGIGVRGDASVPAGVGVRGDSPSGYGVHGVSTNASSWGVRGNSTNGGGVAGISASNTGVYGTSGTGWAGWFDGNVNVTGACCAAAEGTFKIDHPLAPENKYLVQSAVQSADMMSVYSGNATTDAKGEAIVALPDYVEALNADFRYQITVLGQFAQAIVSQEIKNNHFTIKTDKPNVKVSWQVTGVRQDAYARAHPVKAEVEKTQAEKGKYRHPTEHGQPESKGMGYAERQRIMEEPPTPQEPNP